MENQKSNGNIFRKFMEKKVLYFILICLVITNSISLIYIAILVPKTDSTPIYSAISIENISISVNTPNMENISWYSYKSSPVVTPSLKSESAGDNGNLYAPDIIIEDGLYKMWYGGQGDNGHDQIHFAISDNGIDWQKYGVVIPNLENNHVNDPSVVKKDGIYYMYYTTAPEHEMDVISLATSENGINWTIIGNVLEPSEVGKWDSFKVGRPSVLYEEGIFKMWYDGMEIDPENPTKWKNGTGRHVGYATSINGVDWTRHYLNPIYYYGGAVDVEHIGDTYFIVQESGNGTLWSYSQNETAFQSFDFLFNKTNLNFDKYGHVTPFILKDNDKWISTYVGVTTDSCWCQNRIAVWYPTMKTEILNDEDSIVTPSESYMDSVSRVNHLFYDDTDEINHLNAKNDGSWDGKFRLYTGDSIIISELNNFEKNSAFHTKCEDFHQNTFIFSENEQKFVKISYQC